MLKTLRIGLAAALLMVAGPAMAAMAPANTFVDNLVATPVVSDCLASFDPHTAILLVEAETGCDALLAEATGLCLVPVAIVERAPVAAVFDPDLGISCTSARPAPPG